jgi:hypothetical protein
MFQLYWTKIADRQIEPPLDLPIGVLTGRRRPGCNAFEPCDDVDPSPMRSPSLSSTTSPNECRRGTRSGARAAGRRCGPRCLALQSRNARRQPRCGTRRLARRRALDHATVVDGARRLDEVAAQRTNPRQSAVLVSAGESAEPNDIGRQDRCKRPGLSGTRALRMPSEARSRGET